MNIVLNDSVKNAIDSVISSENYEMPPQIDVMDGPDIGQGYASKTCAITIKGKHKQTLELFVKYLPEDINGAGKDIYPRAFQLEFKFYNEIYPVFNNFEKEKNIKEPFNHVPKYYSTNVKSYDAAPPIIMDNLRSFGYTLRNKPIDDDHLKLTIRAFARYHAISYAIKDQQPDVFKRISPRVSDLFTENFKKFRIDEIVSNCVQQFLDSLDPLLDKKLLDNCMNLPEVLIQHTFNIPEAADKYSVICQGDCWSNNAMFLYDDKTGLPIDVKLIDWQFQRVNSPLLDFSYFFYTIATKEFLDNAEHYLNLYYEILSERIKELGSDPEIVFSYNIFLEHWKKFSLFGLTMAFVVVKGQLFEPDEVPNLLAGADPVETFTIILRNQDKYIERMREIVQYFIDNGFL